MDKKQTNFRLSKAARASLRALAETLNVSQAAALEIAIMETLDKRRLMIGNISVSIGQSPSRKETK